MHAYQVAIACFKMLMSIDIYVWDSSGQLFWWSLRLVQYLFIVFFLNIYTFHILVWYVVLILLSRINDIAILLQWWVSWWKVFPYFRHIPLLVWKYILSHLPCTYSAWYIIMFWLRSCYQFLRRVWGWEILYLLWSYFARSELSLDLSIF